MAATETMELGFEELGLVRTEPLNAVQLFTGGGLNAVLERIEQAVRAIPLDPSTASGREQIRSVAYKVVRTKTTLDAEGKKLTEEWRKNTAKVNEERKRSSERLEALADEVRKPLTEFENKEKIRVAAHEAALAEMSGLFQMLLNYPDMAVKLLEEHLIDFSALHAGWEWEEFADRAKKLRHDISLYLIGRIESRKKFDAEQAELARLRAAEVERQRIEYEERLKAEAAEKARLEAERIANEAADSVRREHEEALKAAAAVMRKAEEEAAARLAKEKADRLAAEALAEEKRLAEENARRAAEKRAQEAETARIASEKKAAAERLAAEVKAAEELKAAQDKAKRDSEAAAKREREKIEKERLAVEAETKRREADKTHKAKIRAEILEDLINSIPANGMACEEIADTIISGNLRHVKVIF